MKVKKRVIAMIVGLMTVCSLSMTGTAFAVMDTGEEELEVLPTEEEYLVMDDNEAAVTETFDTKVVNDVTAVFKRTSNTKAQAIAEGKSTISSATLSSTIYLQRQNSNTGKYANVKDAKSVKSVSSSYIKHAPVFSVSKSSNYRVKVVITDGKSTETRYKALT